MKSTPLDPPLSEWTRPGKGEFLPPGHGSEPGADLRIVFWAKLIRVEPRVLQTLETDVLPHYRAAFGQKHHGNALDFLFRAEEDGWDDWIPLSRSLQCWATSFNLAVSWIYDTVLETLHAWCYEGPYPELQRLRDERRVVHRAPRSYAKPEEIAESFLFARSGWKFTFQTAADFKEEALAAYAKRLDEYIRRTAERAEAQGFQTTGAAKQGGEKGKDPHRHFEWLALRRCCRKTVEQIAREYGVTASSVGDGARAAEALLGFPPTRRGRPRRAG